MHASRRRHPVRAWTPAAALADAQQAGDTKVIVQHYPDADAAALRAWADDLRGITGRFVAVAAGSGRRPGAAGGGQSRPGRRGIRLGRGDSQAVGPMIGGGGGGRADLAQAGGRDPSRLDEALAEAARLALEALQPIESS